MGSKKAQIRWAQFDKGLEEYKESMLKNEWWYNFSPETPHISKNMRRKLRKQRKEKEERERMNKLDVKENLITQTTKPSKPTMEIKEGQVKTQEKKIQQKPKPSISHKLKNGGKVQKDENAHINIDLLAEEKQSNVQLVETTEQKNVNKKVNSNDNLHQHIHREIFDEHHKNQTVVINSIKPTDKFVFTPGKDATIHTSIKTQNASETDSNDPLNRIKTNSAAAEQTKAAASVNKRINQNDMHQNVMTKDANLNQLEQLNDSFTIQDKSTSNQLFDNSNQNNVRTTDYEIINKDTKEIIQTKLSKEKNFSSISPEINTANNNTNSSFSNVPKVEKDTQLFPLSRLPCSNNVNNPKEHLMQSKNLNLDKKHSSQVDDRKTVTRHTHLTDDSKNISTNALTTSSIKTTGFVEIRPADTASPNKPTEVTGLKSTETTMPAKPAVVTNIKSTNITPLKNLTEIVKIKPLEITKPPKPEEIIDVKPAEIVPLIKSTGLSKTKSVEVTSPIKPTGIIEIKSAETVLPVKLIENTEIQSPETTRSTKIQEITEIKPVETTPPTESTKVSETKSVETALLTKSTGVNEFKCAEIALPGKLTEATQIKSTEMPQQTKSTQIDRTKIAEIAPIIKPAENDEIKPTKITLPTKLTGVTELKSTELELPGKLTEVAEINTTKSTPPIKSLETAEIKSAEITQPTKQTEVSVIKPTVPFSYGKPSEVNIDIKPTRPANEILSIATALPHVVPNLNVAQLNTSAVDDKNKISLVKMPTDFISDVASEQALPNKFENSGTLLKEEYQNQFSPKKPVNVEEAKRISTESYKGFPSDMKPIVSEHNMLDPMLPQFLNEKESEPKTAYIFSKPVTWNEMQHITQTNLPINVSSDLNEKRLSQEVISSKTSPVIIPLSKQASSPLAPETITETQLSENLSKPTLVKQIESVDKKIPSLKQPTLLDKNAGNILVESNSVIAKDKMYRAEKIYVKSAACPVSNQLIYDESKKLKTEVTRAKSPKPKHMIDQVDKNTPVTTKNENIENRNNACEQENNLISDEEVKKYKLAEQTSITEKSNNLSKQEQASKTNEKDSKITVKNENIQSQENEKSSSNTKKRNRKTSKRQSESENESQKEISKIPDAKKQGKCKELEETRNVSAKQEQSRKTLEPNKQEKRKTPEPEKQTEKSEIPEPETCEEKCKILNENEIHRGKSKASEGKRNTEETPTVLVKEKESRKILEPKRQEKRKTPEPETQKEKFKTPKPEIHEEKFETLESETHGKKSKIIESQKHEKLKTDLKKSDKTFQLKKEENYRITEFKKEEDKIPKPDVDGTISEVFEPKNHKEVAELPKQEKNCKVTEAIQLEEKSNAPEILKHKDTHKTLESKKNEGKRKMTVSKKQKENAKTKDPMTQLEKHKSPEPQNKEENRPNSININKGKVENIEKQALHTAENKSPTVTSQITTPKLPISTKNETKPNISSQINSKNQKNPKSPTQKDANPKSSRQKESKIPRADLPISPTHHQLQASSTESPEDDIDVPALFDF